MSDLTKQQCIHRAGCPKPEVCGKVGHCTSMTVTDLAREQVPDETLDHSKPDIPITSNRISTKDVLKRLESFERWDDLWNLRPLVIEDLKALNRLKKVCALHGLDTGLAALRSTDETTPKLLEGSFHISPDERDARRYRFLRQPGNAIVYAKDRHAWGQNASGHVRYDTAEQLDAAVDAAMGGSSVQETTRDPKT